MIDREEVISYFDKCAASWDEEMIRSEEVISLILDNAGVAEGARVLDVACGTGVLFDDYLKRGVSSVTGIDISPEMVRRAQEKYSDPRINIICGDVEELNCRTYGGSGMLTPDPLAICNGGFDIVMVYNAFPHFPNPERLIAGLAGLTKPGGRLSIAHGMSRAKIDAHHSGSAANVSNHLISAEELSSIMCPYFDVDTVISDDRMYQVAGRKL